MYRAYYSIGKTIVRLTSLLSKSSVTVSCSLLKSAPQLKKTVFTSSNAEQLQTFFTAVPKTIVAVSVMYITLCGQMAALAHWWQYTPKFKTKKGTWMVLSFVMACDVTNWHLYGQRVPPCGASLWRGATGSKWVDVGNCAKWKLNFP